MTPRTLAWTLLAGVAAGCYAAARRRSPGHGGPLQGAVGPAQREGRPWRDASPAPSPPGPGTGAESPNAAERLQQQLAGVSPTVAMSGSSSQQGAEPAATGLPDFTRGA